VAVLVPPLDALSSVLAAGVSALAESALLSITVTDVAYTTLLAEIATPLLASATV